MIMIGPSFISICCCGLLARGRVATADLALLDDAGRGDTDDEQRGTGAPITNECCSAFVADSARFMPNARISVCPSRLWYSSLE